MSNPILKTFDYSFFLETPRQRGNGADGCSCIGNDSSQFAMG